MQDDIQANTQILALFIVQVIDNFQDGSGFRIRLPARLVA
jgi:hypothetical protein